MESKGEDKPESLSRRGSAKDVADVKGIQVPTFPYYHYFYINEWLTICLTWIIKEPERMH